MVRLQCSQTLVTSQSDLHSTSESGYDLGKVFFCHAYYKRVSARRPVWLLTCLFSLSTHLECNCHACMWRSDLVGRLNWSALQTLISVDNWPPYKKTFTILLFDHFNYKPEVSFIHFNYKLSLEILQVKCDAEYWNIYFCNHFFFWSMY